MEQVGGFVPVNPHTSQVVSQKVVERIAGEKAQTVWDPVGLLGRIIEISLRPLSKVPDGLCTFLICAGPDTKGNSIKRMGRVLLENEGMVNTVWLASASADFDVMRKTSLETNQSGGFAEQ